MIEGHPYMAMLVTGILHWVLGVSATITALVGMFSVDFSSNVFRTYCILALIAANLVSLVGSLGTSAGRKKFSDSKTQLFKKAYLVTSILSACIFSIAGMVFFCLIFTVAWALDDQWASFIPLGYAGTAIMALEFVLAIVSASICCCWSK